MQYLMQIDLKGWGVGYIRSFQLHCLLQMLNGVAGNVSILHVKLLLLTSWKIAVSSADGQIDHLLLLELNISPYYYYLVLYVLFLYGVID